MTERYTKRKSSCWIRTKDGRDYTNYTPCWESIERIEIYETAAEEERLLILPCKIGTPVYVLSQSWKGWTIRKKKFSYAMIGKVGKTVFLAEELAEEARKALEVAGKPGDGTTA